MSKPKSKVESTIAVYRCTDIHLVAAQLGFAPEEDQVVMEVELRVVGKIKPPKTIGVRFDNGRMVYLEQGFFINSTEYSWDRPAEGEIMGEFNTPMNRIQNKRGEHPRDK